MVSVSAVRVAGVGGGGESAIFFEGSGGDALGVDENGRAITIRRSSSPARVRRCERRS